MFFVANLLSTDKMEEIGGAPGFIWVACNICRDLGLIWVQGNGGSFKDRKPIGEVSWCDSCMAERTDGPKVAEALSLSLSLYPSTYLSVCLPTCLPFTCLRLVACLPGWLAGCLCLSVCLSVCLPACLAGWLVGCLSVYLSVWLSVCLSLYLSVSLCIYLFIRLSVYLTIYYLPTFLPIWKQLCETLRDSARLPSKLPSQMEKVECRAGGLASTSAFCDFFPLHVSEALRLPQKSEAKSYDVLHQSHKITSANLKI